MSHGQNNPRKYVKLIRLANDLRQADLASAVGISGQKISRIERGVMTPPREIAQKIANTLGKDIATLFPEVLND